MFTFVPLLCNKQNKYTGTCYVPNIKMEIQT